MSKENEKFEKKAFILRIDTEPELLNEIVGEKVDSEDLEKVLELEEFIELKCD